MHIGHIIIIAHIITIIFTLANKPLIIILTTNTEIYQQQQQSRRQQFRCNQYIHVAVVQWNMPDWGA